MRFIFVVLLCLPLMALDNGITVSDATGVGVSRPVTVPRIFSQGEFPSGTYPKPRIGGVVPAGWQVDVKTTWPDGSVMQAFVSFHVALSANGSASVDFVTDSNPCHLGNISTCQAAALSQGGMTGFDTGGGAGSWDFVFQGTANAITYSASAKAMVGAGAWAYWLRGPVVTRVLVEDVSRPNPAFDFGWQWDGAAWQAPSEERFKSIHPMFMVSFYPGYTAGVEGEVIAESPWTSRLQRQIFDLEVQTFSGSIAYSKAAFDLPARSMFTRMVWSGAAPGDIQIDHNLKYLISTKVLPPYDYTQSVPVGSVNSRISAYDSRLAGDDPQSCSNSGYCASWLKAIPTTGGRGEIALIPQWYLDALFTMGDAVWTVADRKTVWDKLLIGNADAGLTIPMRLRELENNAPRDSPSDGRRYYFNYDSDTSTAAWGRVVTAQSRPLMRTYSNSEEVASSTDAITLACGTGICDGGFDAPTANKKGWTVDAAHWPSFFGIPYILTGRYSYLLSTQETAAAWIMNTSSSCYGYDYRCAEWGLLGAYSNPRWVAWIMRENFLAAVLSPDGTAEKRYFQDIINRNDAFYEGAANVIGGNAQSAGACTPTVSVGGSTSTITSASCDGNGCTAFRPNGYRRYFIQGRAPFISAPTVKVNGATKTVGVLGVDSGRDWYYIPGGVVIWQDAGGATLTAADTIAITWTGGNPLTPWCSGRHIFAKSQTGLFSWPWMALGAAQGLGSNVTSALGGFMGEYWFSTVAWIQSSGAVVNPATAKPAFYDTARALAEFAVGRFHSPDFEPYFADQYTIPLTQLDGTLPQTWAQYRTMFDTASTLDAGIGAAALSFIVTEQLFSASVPAMDFRYPGDIKIENEWVRICGTTPGTPSGKTTMTVCTGGRGLYGTTAASHATGATVSHVRNSWGYDMVGHAYSNLVLCTAAMYADQSASNGSGLGAWDKALGAATGLGSRASEPQWMIVPRDRITNVRATPGTGTLALRWVAPSGEACRVYVGATAPPTSSDSGDATATVVSREQSYLATGLQAGTAYYRISCGTGRVAGTATVL
jgi:hypothetical protein